MSFITRCLAGRTHVASQNGTEYLAIPRFEFVTEVDVSCFAVLSTKTTTVLRAPIAAADATLRTAVRHAWLVTSRWRWLFNTHHRRALMEVRRRSPLRPAPSMSKVFHNCSEFKIIAPHIETSVQLEVFGHKPLSQHLARFGVRRSAKFK